MPSLRATLRVLLPFALHAAAREVDRAVGVLLHTQLDLPGFVAHALALVDVQQLLAGVLAWTGAGSACWLVVARLHGGPRGEALESTASAFAPLLLRPALTALALVSLALRPAYPYAFTLPVALTQDWAPGQDVFALAFVLAACAPHLRRLRVPVGAPDAASLGLLVFLAYALLSPHWARQWGGHPGNEPKTLRMAVALGHWWSLDVEPVSGPMETLPVDAPHVAAGRALRESARHTVAMAAALPEAFDAASITASRITRQTIRGKEGGVYHVLAPGTSLVLAPALRLDRAINLRRGEVDRVAVTLLLWNALAAWLVVAVFQLARDASGRPGLSAALAALCALVPPYLFYFYQFYPEMLGALAFALLLRRILFGSRWTARTAVAYGLLLALLPWLHQKFLPLWGVLCIMAFVRVVADLATLRTLLLLVLPQVATLVLTALYNFAIAGSVRPDALFIAWGPRGISSARLGQGLLGLLLDARYGLLAYAPLFALGIAGLVRGSRGARRLLLALPAVAVYYLTIAAADNWSGATCNLGRYQMPFTPWLVALAACGLAGARAGAAGLALAAAGWTGLVAVPLWHDPHAANDCALLLAKSRFADGHQYVPNLFLRTWSEAAPGLAARIAAWVLLGVALAVVFRRNAAYAGRTLAAVVGLVLVLALGLEQWPTARTAPRFADALEIEKGVVAFAGRHRVETGTLLVRGDLDVLVRTYEPSLALVATVTGEGTARPGAGPPSVLSIRGTQVVLQPERLVELRGRGGALEYLYRVRLDLDARGTALVRLRRP